MPPRHYYDPIHTCVPSVLYLSPLHHLPFVVSYCAILCSSSSVALFSISPPLFLHFHSLRLLPPFVLLGSFPQSSPVNTGPGSCWRGSVLQKVKPAPPATLYKEGRGNVRSWRRMDYDVIYLFIILFLRLLNMQCTNYSAPFIPVHDSLLKRQLPPFPVRYC